MLLATLGALHQQPILVAVIHEALQKPSNLVPSQTLETGPTAIRHLNGRHQKSELVHSPAWEFRTASADRHLSHARKFAKDSEAAESAASIRILVPARLPSAGRSRRITSAEERYEPCATVAKPSSPALDTHRALPFASMVKRTSAVPCLSRTETSVPDREISTAMER